MPVLYLIIGFALGAIVALIVYFFLNKNIASLHTDNAALRADNALLKEESNAKTQQITDLSIECERLKSDNANNEAKLSAQKEEISNLRDELNKEFKILANEIFEEKTRKFSQLNEEKLQSILNPLKENINKFEKKIDETYNNETREKTALKKELEHIININRQMSDDAQKLTNALKGDKKLQGNWGEMQLEQILEKSGLERNLHYVRQEYFADDEGNKLIPDYVINLPQDKHYIIDSKVSLVNYERSFNADSDEDRLLYLNEHIKDIKKHIDLLSRKNYHQLTNTPDFVFMYFAFESALFSALQHDNTLFDYAFKKNIILVSTTTLLASLRTVSFIWTQENQRKYALEIAKQGGQLYDKFVGFIDNMVKVGRSLDTAKSTYQDAMHQLVKHNANGSYNAGTIVGQAEVLKNLGATVSKQIPKNILDMALKEDGGNIEMK